MGKKKSVAASCALVGVMAASLSVFKLVLSFIPNVEVVTLLCALYGYTMGPLGVLASLVFVLLEVLIYGVGIWLVEYIIHWPLVALIFFIFAKIRVKSKVTFTITAVFLTFCFGVMTAVIDQIYYGGITPTLLERIFVYYLRGVSFYITQIITNLIVFPTVFKVLADRIKIITKRM
jgi:hypothetical protein